MLASKSGFYMCRSDNIDVYLPDNNTPVSILTYVDKQEKNDLILQKCKPK